MSFFGYRNVFYDAYRMYIAMVYRQQVNLGFPSWRAVKAETGVQPLSQKPATVNKSFLCKGLYLTQA